MTRLVAMYPDVRGKNPFLDLMVEGLRSAGCDVIDWRLAEAAGRRDAFLVLNWLENRAVDPPGFTLGPVSRRRRAEREREYFRRLQQVAELKAQGFRLVWVAHNRSPHKLKRSQATYARRVEPLWALLDGVVHLTSASRGDPAFRHLAHLPSAVVPHPHYPLVAPSTHRGAAGDIQRVAFVGGFAARKRATPAIRAAMRTTLEVVVTGTPTRRQAIRFARPGRAGSLQIVKDPVSDERLFAVFDGSTAAVLADPDALNSGVALFALSRGAPVIVPDTPTNRELEEEFGDMWVRRYRGTLAKSVVLEATRAPIPEHLPDMSRRAPRRFGEDLMQALDTIASPPTAFGIRGSTGG